MSGTIIVDDHPLFREGLKSALEAEGDFSPVSQAGSLAEASELLARGGGAELAVIDLNLPDGTGYELLERFSGLVGSPRLFVLSMHQEQAAAIKAVQAGADGYASKQMPLASLVLALRLSRSGQLFIESEILKDILTVTPLHALESEEARRAVGRLSARERECLALLAEGDPPKEVAAALGVSLRTAENYQSAIYAKLGLGSPAALVRLAIRAGLIEP